MESFRSGQSTTVPSERIDFRFPPGPMETRQVVGNGADFPVAEVAQKDDEFLVEVVAGILPQLAYLADQISIVLILEGGRKSVLIAVRIPVMAGGAMLLK